MVPDSLGLTSREPTKVATTARSQMGARGLRLCRTSQRASTEVTSVQFAATQGTARSRLGARGPDSAVPPRSPRWW
eukprot:8668493-Pyramimonas_sp.AAC.1